MLQLGSRFKGQRSLHPDRLEETWLSFEISTERLLTRRLAPTSQLSVIKSCNKGHAVLLFFFGLFVENQPAQWRQFIPVFWCLTRPPYFPLSTLSKPASQSGSARRAVRAGPEKMKNFSGGEKKKHTVCVLPMKEQADGITPARARGDKFDSSAVKTHQNRKSLLQTLQASFEHLFFFFAFYLFFFFFPHPNFFFK